MIDSQTLADTLHKLNQDGELRRTLIKHRIQNLLVYSRGEDSASGLCRWSLLGYQYNRLATVYKELGLDDLKEYMRGYKPDSSRGAFTFLGGTEYSSFDANLLGGDGSGAVLKEFWKAGFAII